jgi:hypothetical protein
MGESKKRGGKKAHRKRVAKRNQQIKADFKAIEHLKKSIYEEAKERYKQEQETKTKWNLT